MLIMDQIIVKTPAKINLTLEIVNKREDGFHNIQSIMQLIDLYDYLKKNGYKFSDAGCHYDATTSKKIYNYLKSQV